MWPGPSHAAAVISRNVSVAVPVAAAKALKLPTIYAADSVRPFVTSHKVYTWTSMHAIMVWYFVLVGISISVVVGLLIPYIRKRYIDIEMTTCALCGNRHRENSSCPKCGGR